MRVALLCELLDILSISNVRANHGILFENFSSGRSGGEVGDHQEGSGLKQISHETRPLTLISTRLGRHRRRLMFTHIVKEK